MIYNDVSGLHMGFLEWRNLSRDSRKKRYNHVQIDEDKDLDDMYSIKNVSGLDVTAVPDTNAFQESYLYKSTSNFNNIRT